MVNSLKPRLSGDCSGNHISEGLNFPSYSGKYASQSLKRACKQAQYSTLSILHPNECWYWPTLYQICQGVTFTFPHISMISSTHHGMKKVRKHTNLKEFAQFFKLCISHNKTKIEAMQNLPLEGPGTASANLHIHSDPVSAKLHIRVSYLLSSDNLLCILMTTLRVHYHSIICNGYRTELSPIWSVIIQVINKIRQPQSMSPIC